MKTLLLAGLLAAATPAYADSIKQFYKVEYDSYGGGNHFIFGPYWVEPDQPHNVGDVAADFGVDVVTIVSSQPITEVNTEITLKDALGDLITYDDIFTFVATAVDVAAMFGAPVGDIAAAMTVGAFVDKFYGPATKIVYGGLHDLVGNIIGAGITSMNAIHIPIGPDPHFEFEFKVGATTFTGSFDAYGGFSDYDHINNIHDVTLFVDGIPANGGATIPEPSTWAMLLVGFAGLGFCKRKAGSHVLTVFPS